jgi:hypothetical protein
VALIAKKQRARGDRDERRDRDDADELADELIGATAIEQTLLPQTLGIGRRETAAVFSRGI